MSLRRKTAALLASLMMLSTLSVFGAAKDIIIDGETAEIPQEMGSIREMDDRTFVPIRFVMEYLGCHVDYDDVAKMATISSDTHAYLIQEGNSVLYILSYDDSTDDSQITMDTVPFIDDAEGRMYIPIRFLAEAIGYEVGWDEETEIVTLNMKK